MDTFIFSIFSRTTKCNLGNTEDIYQSILKEFSEISKASFSMVLITGSLFPDATLDRSFLKKHIHKVI